MKVQVSKLKPNPYRKISKYPFDKEKLKALRHSIKETTFWDNILARPVKGGYEIAYGHHRLKVIRSLGIKTVDIPVRDLDNATMLRIMANENLDEWKMSPAVVNETVLAAKEFLDGELAKCGTVKDIPSYLIDLLGTKNEDNYMSLRSRGVGQTTILKFLGGNWKQWVIQEALSTLNDDDIDREAVEMMPSVEQAKNFKQAVKSAGVPRAAQKVIAKKVIESGVGSRGTADIVDFCVSRKKKKTALAPKKPQKDIDDFVLETTGMAAALTPKIKAIARDIDHIQSDRLRARFVSACTDLYNQLAEIE